ncbi:MAG: lysylphosphatidylglycerol synthase transmembrane domain-containing protein [bacterium]
MEKVKKHIFISLTVAAIIYLALSFYADYDSVIKSFANFNWLYLPVLLLLSYLNYSVRFLKWDYYIHLLNIKLSRRDSFNIFMSGLVMSVTPGKMGELLKSYLVKKITNEPISRTAPIIVVERLTDFLSLLLLALMGSYVFDYGRPIIIGSSVFFILIVMLISSKKMSFAVIDMFGKIGFVKKHIKKVHDAYESSYQMLRPRPLFYMILVSLVSWFFECFGFYLILFNFNVADSVLLPTFIYAFATIVGSLTMLPGGLGVTDGSLTFLLTQRGVSLEIAVASTFIIRVVTLWFAVLVGAVTVMLYQKTIGKVKFE